MVRRKNRAWVVLSAVAGAGVVAALAWPHLLPASRGKQAGSIVDPSGAGGKWLSDMPTALSMARASGKQVLIQFAESPVVGTDSAFDSDAFRAAASKTCVLVRLSSSADVSPEYATQVATWGERLKVNAFPTLAILDSQGRPCAAKVCSSTDGADSLRTLASLQGACAMRDAALAAAARATGAERARLLDGALSAVGDFANEYPDVMQQIADADADNVAGFKGKYEHRLAAGAIEKTIQTEVYPLIDGGNLTAAIARLEQLGRGAHAQTGELQMILAFEGQLYFSLGDRPRAVALLDQAIALAPDSEPASKVRAARAQIAGDL